MTTSPIPSSTPALSRILFVDDYSSIRRLAAIDFRNLGMPVDIFANCEEALAAAEGRFAAGNPYAAVLTDNHIEGIYHNRQCMDGSQFIAELVKRKREKQGFVGDIYAVSSTAEIKAVRSTLFLHLQQIAGLSEAEIREGKVQVDIFDKINERALVALVVVCKIENPDQGIKELTRDDFIHWLGFELNENEFVIDGSYALEEAINNKIRALSDGHITLGEITDQVRATRTVNAEGAGRPSTREAGF